MKQLTTYEFVTRAKAVHNNKYDYCDSIYDGSSKKTNIICPTHGVFIQIANDHLQGYGCPSCGNNRLNTKNERRDTFLKDAVQVHGDRYDYKNTDYKNSQIKIIITCSIHGPFSQRPTQHLQGNGCPACGLNSRSLKRRLCTSDIIQRCNEIHNFAYEYAIVDYKNTDSKIVILCNRHGMFLQTVGNHLQGHGCPRCAVDYIASTHQYGLNDFITKAAAIHYGLYDYSQAEYTDAHTNINIVCPNHGTFSQLPGDHLCGAGCPRCGIINREQTNLNTIGVKYPTQIHIDPITLNNLNNANWMLEQHKVQRKTMEQISKDCGVSPKTVKSYLLKHDIAPIRFGGSQGERDLTDFIKSVLPNTEIIINSRDVISPQEIDIYIPSLNLAIEFDGLYWHSELQGKDKKYHLNKTQACEKLGIRLVHIFENEWDNRQDVVRARLMNILQQNVTKIYARKCVINDTMSAPATRVFMNENHIQGYAPSSINLALMHDNEIVAMMTLGKSRFNKAFQYELIRFVVKKEYSVVGGASKLFKHFIKSFNPTSVITYSDKRWNTGKLYSTLGFTYTHTAAPNYFYFKEGSNQLWSRVHFQKHKLEKQLKVFDPEKTEWENMVIDGYNRIWDCGNDCFSWKVVPT